MKLINLVRNIRGYVLFEVCGGFKERFINLCAGNNINIYDVKYNGFLLNAKIPLNKFSELRKIVNKAGVQIKVKKKCGMPFFLIENRKRMGLMAGAAYYILFVITMNCFIWCIDISGSMKYSTEQIYDAAISAGARFGKCRFFLDEGEIARNIYKQFKDELSWATVNVKGSRLSVEVRDTVIPSEKEPEDKSPCNIVADFDGVIVSDETYSGVKCMSKGSAVKAGDLLISGVVENEDLSASYYKADGRFTALHRISQGYSVDFSEVKSKILSAKRYLFTDIFGIKFPLFFKNPDEISTEFNSHLYLTIRSVILPFNIRIRSYAKTEECLLTEKQAYIMAADLFSEKTYYKLRNSKVTASDVKIKNEKNLIIIESEHDCIDFIGKSKPIITENIKS